MSFIKEAMRFASMISVAEKLYLLAGIIAIAAVPAYRWFKKRSRAKGRTDAVATEPSVAATEPTSVVTEPTSIGATEIPGAATETLRSIIEATSVAPEATVSPSTFDHQGLERTLANLQDQSSAEPTTAFDTSRIKSEIMEPMCKYLLDMDRSLANTQFEFRRFLSLSGRISNVEPLDRFGWEALNELPDQILNLEVKIALHFNVAKSNNKVSDMISIKGWFADGGDGRWTVSRGILQHEERVSPMYDWYGLKQHVNEHVNDVLEQLMAEGRGS